MKATPYLSRKAKGRRPLIKRLVLFFLLVSATFSMKLAVHEMWVWDDIVVKVLERPLLCFHEAIEGSGRVIEDYFFLVGLSQENRELKKNAEILKAQNMLLASKISFLEEALGFQMRLDLSRDMLLAARVVAHDTLANVKTLQINRGREHGIAVDDVVLGAAGLVGRVIRVADRTSQVLLLCDPGFAIDVASSRTGVRLLLTGLTENRLKGNRYPFLTRAEFLEKGAELREGDELLSSGLGDIFPAKIPVGRVLELGTREGKIFDRLVVQPHVDFAKLDHVFVLGHPASPRVSANEP